MCGAFAALCDSDAAGQAALFDAGALSLAIEALKLHTDDPGVQLGVCGLLDSLSSADVIEGAIAAGAFEAVVTAMQTGIEDAVVQRLGCHALARLLTARDAQRAAVAGAIQAALAALQFHRADHHVQEAAIGAVTALAQSDENIAEMTAAGAVDLVAQAMQARSAHRGGRGAGGVRHQKGATVLRALRFLCVVCSSGLRLTCPRPAHPNHTPQEHPRKRRVNESAQIALKALRVSRELAERAIQKSKLLARKLSRAHKSAPKNLDLLLPEGGRQTPPQAGGAAGMGVWPVSAEGRRGPAPEAELLEYLGTLSDPGLVVDTMDANLDLRGVQEAGCKALQLVAIDDEGALRAVDAGAVETAVRALSAHAGSAGVQAQGLRLLQCLLVDSQIRSQALGAGAVETVLAGMDANVDSEQVAEQGACALAALAVSLAGRLRCVTCGGLDILLRSAPVPPPRIPPSPVTFANPFAP